MDQLNAAWLGIKDALPSEVPDWGWAVLALAVVLVLLLRFYSARVAWRVIVQFLLTIALPLGLIVGAALYGVAQLVTIDTPVWQAIIAATIIATGWLTTAVFSEVGRNRDRAERLRDVHRALYAEIRTHVANLQSDEVIAEYGRQMIAIMEVNPGFIPFVPRENSSQVYETLLSEIQVLPRQTIDPIVGYHTQQDAIAALVDDMRSDTFRNLAQERRVNMYRDYIEMKRQAASMGERALREIETYSGASKRRVNTRAADRSAR